MKRYLAGIVAVSTGVWLLVAWLSLARWSGPGEAVRSVLLIVLLPSVLAWVATEIVHARRPRRVFCGRRRGTGRLLLLGAVTAALAWLLSALGLALLDRWIPDPMIVGTLFAACSLAVALAIKPWRDGSCLYCAYDLRGHAPISRCTECGEPVVDGAV